MPKKDSALLLEEYVFQLKVIYLLSSKWKIPLDPLIYKFMFGATLAIIIGMLITFNWKISVHMIGIGGVVGIVTVISKTGPDVLLYLLNVLIITAWD